MLWLICFLNYADRQAIFSVFPKLESELGIDKVKLGLIGSAFMWVYAAGSPIAGYVGDRLRRKDLILGGCLFWSAITSSTALCARAWQFVTVRAAEGLGECFYFPASMSLISDYHGPATRSRAMSLHQSGVYAGTIAGGWLAAYLAERWGWRWGFYFFGIAGILVAIALYAFLREPRREAARVSEHADSGPVSIANPVALLLMVAFVGANFVATIFLTWTPTFLFEKFHFRLTAAGLSGSLFIHLASAASVPLGGILADRLSRRFPAGRMLVQACGLLIGAAFVFIVGSTKTTSTLLIAMTGFGLCKGLYDANIFASLYDTVAPRARATAAGIMNTVGWGGGALGPLFVGYFARHGHGASEMENMSRAIAASSLVYIAAAVVLVAAMMMFRRSDELVQD